MADTPQPRSPSDEAILAYVAEGKPHAEIAARLGQPIGEVKRRIERLQSPSPPPLPPVHVPQPQLEPLSPTHSRRSVLGAIGMGTATVGGVIAYLLTRGGSPPVSPDRESPFAPTPTPTPTPTPAPTPAPTPHPGLGALRDGSAHWRREHVPNGGEISFGHGVGFIDTATGETEVITFDPPGRRAISVTRDGYTAVGSGSIYAHWPTADGLSPAGLFNRRTGEALTWDESHVRLLVANDDVQVFAEVPMNPPLAHVHVRSTDGEALAQFTLPTELFNHLNMFERTPILPPASTILFALHPAGEVLVVDLRRGHYEALSLTAHDGTRFYPADVPAAEDGGTALVLAWGGARNADQDAPLAVFRVSIAGADLVEGWDADDYFSRVHGQSSHTQRERFALQNESLLPPRNHPTPMATENWVSSEVHDLLEGRPLFRVLSGLLHPSHARGGRRWLADGSGFVVTAAGPGAPPDSYPEWRDNRRTYIVRLDGTAEPLPGLPPSLRQEHLVHSIAEPSPIDPDLFAIGRALVFNRRLGAYLGPDNPPIAESLDPWYIDPPKVFFVFPPWGTSSDSAVGTLLPPRVEYPPFREHVDLVVARAGTCLDVHEAPDSQANVLACLPNGTPVRVVGAPDGTPSAPPPAPAGYTFWSAEPDGPDRQYFVHVRTETGLEGWVAIQYLDWAL